MSYTVCLGGAGEYQMLVAPLWTFPRVSGGCVAQAMSYSLGKVELLS